MKLTKVISNDGSICVAGIKAVDDDNIGSFSVNSTIRKYEKDDEKTFPSELVNDSSVTVKIVETDIDGKIQVTKWDSSKREQVVEIIEASKEEPRPFAEENVYLSDTYTLIRTNPKFTGNVKLVVDSKEDMYLDTFKVNTALSKTKYHKVPVSYKSYYGKDVMALFTEMSSDDFYCVSEDDKKIFTQAPNLSKQFIDTYRSGVKTNIDTTYSESFSILSPLNIGSIVPDFFVVFKVKNSTPGDIDKKDIFEYLLRYGEQIKTFDLRKDSKVGQYLRTIRKYSVDVAAPIFMSRMDDAQVVYNGISIDKGVVTKAYETNKRSKKYNKIDSKSYEEMNYNFVEGFERNRLISCNTINLEFMFDDPTSDQFSINTYVGLYLYSNNLFKDIYYDGSLKIDNGKLAYENGYSEIKTSGEEGVINDNEDNLNLIMYGFEDSDGFTRCKSTAEEQAYKDYIKCTLGENVINTNVSKIDTNEKYDSFITITLNNESAISPGEHYRILDYVDTNENEVCPCVYEVIISDETSTGEIVGQESIYYKKGFTIKDSVNTEMEVCTHTIPIYVNNIAINYNDESLSAEEKAKLLNEKIKMVAKYIYNALNSFTTDQKNTIRFKATRYHDSTITISGDIVDDTNTLKKLVFERISHLTAYTAITGENSIASLKEFTEDDKAAVTVFGNYSPIPMVIDFSDPSASCPTHKDERACMLTPFYFEDLKARIVYAIDFYDFTNKGADSDVVFYDGYVDLTESMQDENLCYLRRFLGTDGKYTTEYTEYDKIKISMYELNEENSVAETSIETNALLSFRNPKKYMFRFKNHVPEDGKLSLHKHNLFDRVICNIIPIKDYDFALNGEDNTWNVTQRFLDDMTSYNNTAKDIVYNLIKIGATPSNEGYYDETAGTFIAKLYKSGKSIVNSFVSPYIFKWTTIGSISSGGSDGIRQKAYGAKNNVPYKNFYHYETMSGMDKYGTLYKKDLSKIYNRETLRTNIINGIIDFNDIIDEIKVTQSLGSLTKTKSTIDYTEGSKLYKISNDSFCFIDRGVPIKVSFANITNTSVLDNINGCVIHNIESKPTGDDYGTELYVDQIKKKAYFVSYGDSSVSEKENKDYIEYATDVLPSSIILLGNGSLKMHQKLFKNTSGDDNVRVSLILHNNLYTIMAPEASYDGEYIKINDYTVFFRKTLPKSKHSYDMMDKDFYMGIDATDEQKVKFMSTVSHLLSKTSPFKLYVKDNLSGAYNQAAVLPTDLTYLPVYLKFGDDSGYTLYEDNYDVSVSQDVVYDSSISPIYTNSDKMRKTLNTYITPKLVDVFFRGTIDLKLNNGDELSCENMYGFNWRGDIPYNKYWGTDYNPNITELMADKDIVMVDAEFCKITDGSTYDFPNILRNCFDKNMYHAKAQYKYIKSLSGRVVSKPVLLNRDSNIAGYASGYMIKTFVNGLSLQKKKTNSDGSQTSLFEINGWTKIFKKNGYIYYDLSDSIEKQIMANTNFSEIWKYLNANTRENKVKFINNTIVPMLHITDNMVVDVYFKVGKANSFSNKFSTTKTKKIDNASVNVEYENGRYLLKLKPQNTLRGTYYIKCNITL